jgi:hypothetical protein
MATAQHPLHRGCDEKEGTLIDEKITGKIYWATFSPAFCWTVIQSSVGMGECLLPRLVPSRAYKERDRGHAHRQSLGRGVSADAFGKLYWLSD